MLEVIYSAVIDELYIRAPHSYSLLEVTSKLRTRECMSDLIADPIHVRVFITLLSGCSFIVWQNKETQVYLQNALAMLDCAAYLPFLFFILLSGCKQMNIFDEAISVLKSKVQIRKLFQDMHAEDMQRVISRIEAIYEEKLMAQMEAEEENARKREAVEAVLKQMQELGLSADDIQSSNGEVVRKGKPRQRYQFCYENAEGESIDWEGATTGRIPGEFSDYLTRTGKDRKDCIVAEL